MPLIRLYSPAAKPGSVTTARTTTRPDRVARRIGGVVHSYNLPTEPLQDGLRYMFRPFAFAGSVPTAVLCWDHDQSRKLADSRSGLQLTDNGRRLRFTADLPWTADAEYEQVRKGNFRGMSLGCRWNEQDAYRVGDTVVVRWATLMEISPVVDGAQKSACVGVLSDDPSRDPIDFWLLEHSRFAELRSNSYRRYVRPRPRSNEPTVLEQHRQRLSARSRPSGRQLIYSGGSGGLFG